MSASWLRLALGLVLIVAVAGCGLDVQSPDLFLLTRTGPGKTLTLLVNDSGTISCDRATAKPISNAILIQARDLSDDLAADATKGLTIARQPGSVDYYRIRMSQGTIAFPDRAGAKHHELAEAELFATQAAQGSCGLGG
jgi:hypothetical protein